MTKLFRSAAVSAAAIAAVAGMSTAAHAATEASATAQAEILTALSVAVDTADDTLDFGTLADGGITTSTDVVLGANGTIGACPANIVCGGTTDSPTFNISGLAASVVDISFKNATETLTHTGTSTDAITLKDFTTSAASNQVTLNGSGAGSFTIGGTLVMTSGLDAGVYDGMVTVQVAYN